MIPEKTVYLLNLNILQTAMSINGETRNSLGNIGTFLSVPNGKIVRKERVTGGRMAQVRCYDVTTRSLHFWTTVVMELRGRPLEVEALLVHDVELDCLHFRPDMKQLRLTYSGKTK